MDIGHLLVDILQTGTITLIGTKFTKAIGQKEISELISGIGIMICGADVVMIISPVGNWILNTTKVIGDTITLLNEWGVTVGKLLHIGG